MVTPQGRANGEAAIRLLEESLEGMKRRHHRLGARVAEAVMRGPIPSAYRQALASGDSELADAYVATVLGYLAAYMEEGKGQTVLVCAYLLAQAKDGNDFALCLLDTMPRIGLVGPNSG